MAVLPSWKRIIIGDYPKDSQALVEKLAASLNIAIDSLFSALANRLTFTSNFAATQTTFTVSVGSNGNPVNPVSFQLNTVSNNNAPPQIMGVLVLSATDQTNPNTYPTGAPFVSFTQNGKTLNVNNITGLVAKDTWSLTVVALNSGT